MCVWMRGLQLADALHTALNMNPEERTQLHNYAYNYVTTHTAQAWAEQFLFELRSCEAEDIFLQFPVMQRCHWPIL